MAVASANLSTQSFMHHAVQLYHTPSSVLSGIAAHAAFGFSNGDGVLLVPLREHLAPLDLQLSLLCADLAERKSTRQIVIIPAEDLLATFMENGMPVRERCLQIVGAVLDAQAARFPSIRVYGEMVEALLRAGNVHATVALEHLWNEVAATRPFFSLICGYSTETLRTHNVCFSELCCAHGRVHPAEESEAAEDEQVDGDGADFDSWRRRTAEKQVGCTPVPLLAAVTTSLQTMGIHSH